MASLSTGSDGLHRVYFKAANGSRQILYCGRIPKKKAEGIERCIADLERCRVDGSIPGPATTAWLTDIAPELHAKLAKHGLTRPRAVAVEPPAPTVATLAEVIDRYKARPKFAALADGTKSCHHYSFVQLLAHFGADRDITTITETDAEDLPATLGESYAEATVARIVGAGSMIMRFAVRSRLLSVNPFDEVARGSYVSPHKAYVEAATCQEIIDACPDLETKLVVALARFAGLRTPSEHRVLRWSDVDWSARKFRCDSPKTGPRFVPIRPEVMALLEQQFEAVPDGSEFVLPTVAKAYPSTYHHRISRIVTRLNLDRWKRLMHSMRASMQTDWNETFPAHVTAAWMGNSPVVGDRHYNRTLARHFAEATQNPTQSVTATPSQPAST